MYNCKILADSVSEHYGNNRITTFEISYPYIIHAEIMTHRMFSRNTQSSRATPVRTNIDKVEADPFVPLTFRQNQRGMADGLEISGERLELSETAWRNAIQDAIWNAKSLMDLDVHKALANRVLSPYQWFTMILTATDFDNFFALRCHPEAQAEIRTIAEMMKDQYDSHEPQVLKPGQWHLPLISVGELDTIPLYKLIKICIGRCARVSYLTHQGIRDIEADIALFERLLDNGHMSPFEHAARPFTEFEWRFVDRARDAIGEFVVPDSDPFRGYMRGDQHPFGQYLLRQVAYAGNLHGWWSARMDQPHQSNFALRSN